VVKKIILIIWLCGSAAIVFAVEDITVSGLIGTRAIIQINGKSHVLPVGESSPEGVKVVAIDHHKRRVTLDIGGEEKIYPLDLSGKHGNNSIRVAPDKNGMYRASGKINQVPAQFVVDTGATLVSMNKKVADKISVDYKKSPHKAMSETASGKVQVYLVMLDEVEVDGLRLKNIPAAVHDSEYPSVVLLGMSFLKHLDIRRDGNILHLIRR
jgi:aspartyl protease family protein